MTACARGLRETRGNDDLSVEAELAAEAAAHVIRDHTHVGLRDSERFGDSVPCTVHRLRRNPRRQLLAFPLADAAVRLEARMRLHLRRVQPFDDVTGLGQPFLDVALGALRNLADVPLWKDDGCFRPHGLFDGREMRQHFVVHLDQADGIFRNLLRHCRDGRNLFALVPHFRGFARCRIDESQRGADAREFLCGGEIDGTDARVRMR